MEFSENEIKVYNSIPHDLNKNQKDDKSVKKCNKITKKAIVNSLDEFAQNSTLHGLRYIADRTLSYVEKIFWSIVVIASISLCGLLIRNVWNKWQSSPIIITMNENIVPVNSVRYPSLTICPQIKVKQDKYNFETEREYYQQIMWNVYNITPSQRMRLRKFTNIALVCDTDLQEGVINLRMPYYSVNIKNIQEVALDFEDVFKSCKWNTNAVPCKSLFQKVLIREGVCFIINALDADEIVRSENGINRLFLSNKNYRENLSDIYPIKGSSNDALPEFEVTLKEYAGYEDKSCKRYNTGFLVYLQNPADMPYSSIHSYTVNMNEILSLGLKFESVSATEDLKSYPIQTRQCYFSGERYLQLFRSYTESNCRMECFINYTKQLCGCVAFFMPHDNVTRICPAHYVECIDVAQILLYGYASQEKVKNIQELYYHSDDTMNVSLISRAKEFVRGCNCLPTCNTVNYDADFIKMEYDFEYYLNYFCTRSDICEKENQSFKYAKIEWIFKHPSFYGMIRSSMFGTTDFIAQCGGLLGLFLGFSFLTIVEILYYLTLRFGFIMRR